MPPERRVSGLRVLSNTPPKIVGEISLQSKSNDACSRRVLRNSSVNGGISISSAKRPPLVYGNAANSAFKYLLRFSVGVLSTSNSFTKASRISSVW